MRKAFARLYPTLMRKADTLSKPYRRAFLSMQSRKEIVFKKPQTIVLGHNRFILYFSSSSSSKKDFGYHIFLETNDLGHKEYYHFLVNGSPVRISKHFIERFIERSSYNATKESFLYHFMQDMCCTEVGAKDGDIAWVLSKEGLSVMKDNTFITYMTDLSQAKQEISKRAKEVIEKSGWSRKDAIKSQNKIAN